MNHSCSGGEIGLRASGPWDTHPEAGYSNSLREGKRIPFLK